MILFCLVYKFNAEIRYMYYIIELLWANECYSTLKQKRCPHILKVHLPWFNFSALQLSLRCISVFSNRNWNIFSPAIKHFLIYISLICLLKPTWVVYWTKPLYYSKWCLVRQTKFITFALDRRILMVWLSEKAFLLRQCYCSK